MPSIGLGFIAIVFIAIFLFFKWVNVLKEYERAVTTRTMPLGNRTHMTDAERAVLARWVAAGAPSR